MKICPILSSALLVCVLSAFAAPAGGGQAADKDLKIGDYDWNQAPGKPVAVRSGEITYLSWRSAMLSDRLGRDRKSTGITGWSEPSQHIRWKVASDKARKFRVKLMLHAQKGQKFTVRSPGGSVTYTQPLDGWCWGFADGALALPTGESVVEIRMNEAPGGKRKNMLFTVELTDVNDVAKVAKEQDKYRIKKLHPNVERTYGIMFQWGQWGYAEDGTKKPWPEMINDFDVERFADLCEEMGAGWVTWSVTWASQYMPCPLKVREQIAPGFNCDRDLLMELADAMQKRDIGLDFYYHPGHSTKEFWQKYHGGDRNVWFKNFVKVVAAMGERYGEKLQGWGFDGGRHYYPGPFEVFGRAARAGNPVRLIGYNPWILAPVTMYQNTGCAGEHAVPVKPKWAVNNLGVYTAGPNKDMLAGGNFLPERSGWGIKKPNQKIGNPRMSSQRWLDMVKTAHKNHTTLGPCICMYESGKINRKTYEMFVHTRRHFRGISDEDLVAIRKKRGQKNPVACSYVWGDGADAAHKKTDHTDRADAKKLFDRAQKLQRQGKDQQALQLYMEIIQKYEDTPYAPKAQKKMEEAQSK